MFSTLMLIICQDFTQPSYIMTAAFSYYLVGQIRLITAVDFGTTSHLGFSPILGVDDHLGLLYPVTLPVTTHHSCLFHVPDLGYWCQVTWMHAGAWGVCWVPE